MVIFLAIGTFHKLEAGMAFLSCIYIVLAAFREMTVEKLRLFKRNVIRAMEETLNLF